MTTARKHAAKDQNAGSGTGPETVEGRNILRDRAVRRELAAERVLEGGESVEAFRRMADEHIAMLQPRNAAELECVRQYTIAAWQRERCARAEAMMDRASSSMEKRAGDFTAPADTGAAESIKRLGLDRPDMADKVHRYKKAWARKMVRARIALAKLRSEVESPSEP